MIMTAVPNQRLLVPMSNTPGPVHSVLLHPAGGGLTQYLDLAVRLAERGPVTAIRAAGLLPGEYPHHTVDAMVQAYLPLLEALPDRPTLLVGWSLGGVLAWELAGRLARTGPAPAVVMIDSRAAAFGADDARQLQLTRAVLANVAATSGRPVPDRVRATVAAHVRAANRHTVAPHQPADALLLACGTEDVTERLGDWPAVGGPRLRIERLPGEHFDVFTPKVLPVLLGHLDRFVDSLGESR